MEWDKEFIHIGPWGDIYRQQTERVPFAERTLPERMAAKVLSGHETYYGIHDLLPGRTPRYLTFVREPARRLVSLYNFEMTHRIAKGWPILEFEMWYQDRARNEMTNFYCSRLPNASQNDFSKAKWVLDKCWYVGLTEHLDEGLSLLFHAMKITTKWKNYRVTGDEESSMDDLQHPDFTTPKKFLELNDKLKRKIEKENPLDYKLYQYTLTLNQSGKAREIGK